jgi:hypothetical protein
MVSPVNWNNVDMLTPGLKNLGNQINAWAPDRDGASDGAIGDYAHTQGKSGHNPDDTSHHNAEWDGDSDNKPEIRAIDVDIDFRNGSNAQALVDHIVGLKPSSVLRYVIYNRKIYEASNGWRARDYDGSSPHTEHIHFSGAYSDASDENRTYNYRLEEIPVALTADDKAWIGRAIEEHVREGLVGSKNWPGRTREQFENDVQELRGLLVGDDRDGKSIDPNSPIGRIIKAADKILAPAPTAK